ncbi:MAG: alkaline phosphatase family protein [Polyangiaceae bacterium]
MRFDLVVCLGALAVACCPDDDLQDGPSPCLVDAGAYPEPDSDVPGDGLAEARHACAFGKGDKTSKTLGSGMAQTQRAPADIPIDKIVVVMLENRSFDHYLSELGPPWDVATTETNPDRFGFPVSRQHERTFVAGRDLNHEWEGTHLQYDTGLLDGFVRTNPPDGRGTMNYYRECDIPLYYWLAREFGTSDRYFSSLLGPTWPNRYFFLAGTARGRTTTPSTDLLTLGIEIPELGVASILDQLGAEARVYSGRSPPALTNVMLPGDIDLEFFSIGDFVADAKSGELPPFSFVEPKFDFEDDHPPADIRNGQRFVRKIIEAISSTKTWPHVALFITYDEHGGYFDHVPPPSACEPDELRPATHAYDRLGFRVPLFVVSPYVKKGMVSHMIADHTSITRFVAHRFGLPALTKRDANAWPLLDLFDFSTQPAAFPPILPPAEPKNCDDAP